MEKKEEVKNEEVNKEENDQEEVQIAVEVVESEKGKEDISDKQSAEFCGTGLSILTMASNKLDDTPKPEPEQKR